MSKEKKWYRDCYGSLNTLAISIIVILVLLVTVGAGVGIDLISDHYEVKAFNNMYGTNYTLGEWFWAETTLKDYHLRTVENRNYKVDLNLNQPFNG